jgi:uncharacterized protein YndB with AHSA1/START domain
MAGIKYNLTIKTSPEYIYRALTTQEGPASWWAKQTTAQPQMGFVNTFIFGAFRNAMNVTLLEPNKSGMEMH